MNRRNFCSMLAGLCLLATAGCGAGTELDQSPGIPSTGFSLKILPETALHGTAQCAWDTTVEQTADGCIVSIAATSAAGQKALYFDLEYDAETLHPVAAAPVEGVADCEPLSIAVLDDRGTVHYGQILPKPDTRAGFSGDGVVATVEFEYGAALCGRRVSKAPGNSTAAVLLRDSAPATLEWLYSNKGDCNQDGMVLVSDLTPIGQFYTDGPDVTIHYYSIEDGLWMVDTNSDGVIGIGDITAIGQNYENSVLGGYDIYKADSLLDYPAGNPDGASKLELVTNIPYRRIEGAQTTGYESASGGRHSFSFEVPDPDNRKLYWVLPKDSQGAIGAASNPISQIGLAAPRNDLSAATLTWDDATATLRWDCFVLGDTNYDGAVNVADLTPISQFNMTMAPFASFQNELADADMDGVVNQGDFNEIYRRYGDHSVGYRVYSSLNPAAYPAFNDEREKQAPVDTLSLLEWQGDYSGPFPESRVFLELVITDPVPGTYYWVRHVDDSGGVGTPSNMIQIP